MTDTVTGKLVKLMLIIYAYEYNSYLALRSWLFLRRSWGGQGDLVFGENYLYLGSRICRLGSWLIWLKYSTVLTPWCPALTLPRTGTIAKIERITIAGAWNSEGETADREEKVGKEGDAI